MRHDCDVVRAKRTLVLGGGIAGLAAAAELLRLGRDVILVEAEERVGGLLRTDEREGFRFDRGGHRFITSIPWVLERLRSLLGDRLALRERNSFVMLDGVAVRYPLDFRDLVGRLGVRRNARAFASYLAGRVRGSMRAGSADASLESWLRVRFGAYLYEHVFEGYSRKLWGVEPSEISAEWAAERISIPSLGGFVRELVRPSRRPARTYAKRFLYPHHGIGEIPDAFADEVRAHGGCIRTRARVTSARPTARGWTVRIEGDCGAETVEVDAILSTIPLGALLALLDVPGKPAPPALEYRGLRFVNLGFDREVPLDATWIYQPDPSTRATRVQIPAARSAAMVPSGCGSIQVEEPMDADSTTGARHDSAPNESERCKVAIDRALALLRRDGCDLPDPVVAFETRESYAYPVYRHGARDAARGVLDWLRGWPNLRSTGRQGEFSYRFFDRVIADAVNAAHEMEGREPMCEIGDDPRPIPLEARSLLEDVSMTNDSIREVPASSRIAGGLREGEVRA